MIYFIYNKVQQDICKENLCNKIFVQATKHIKLPASIEVEFENMHTSVYGQTLLDNRYKNRIRLNANLTAKELFKPFVHELAHLNQSYTGKLGVYRNGTVMWEGKPYPTNKPLNELTYKEHSKLPWEQEASYLEKQLLSKLLD